MGYLFFDEIMCRLDDDDDEEEEEEKEADRDDKAVALVLRKTPLLKDQAGRKKICAVDTISESFCLSCSSRASLCFSHHVRIDDAEETECEITFYSEFI